MSHAIFSALRNGLVSVVTLALIFGFYVAAVNAQGTGSAGLSIAPPNTDLTVAPGEQVTRTLEISNPGSGSVDLNLAANNFSASGEGGEAAYAPRGSGGASDWLTLSPATFSLGSGEAKQVSVVISVPSNASAGGHYVTVFAFTTPKGGVEGSGAQVTTAVGANFLLNVTGNVVERASISEFSTPRSRVNAGESVEFNLRIANTGNTHIRPSGVVELFRKGVKVDEVALNPDGANVLPNSTRRFTVKSDKALLPGAYEASATVTYGSGQVLTAPKLSLAVIGDSSAMTLIAGGLAALVVLLALALFAGRKKTVIK